MACTFEGCTGRTYALGLCIRHYTQQRRGTLGQQKESLGPRVENITFRCGTPLRKRAETKARARGVSLGGYIRRLIESDTGPNG